MKLGTLLLRNAAIGLSQLEAALRNQVLYGGRLGTNLVELGFIDLELLSSYLAELTGFPIATPTLLDSVDKQILEALGADEAHRLRSVPLARLADETIAVGMVDPTDAAALEDLKTAFHATIKPYVVPELRALYYLEKHFGLPRRARFLRTARQPDKAEPVKDDRRKAQLPAQGMVMPPAFTLEPRRKRTPSQAATEGIPTAITYGAACERIDTATKRDQIGETFAEYAQGRCDALVVFLIRDGNALGWRSYVTANKQERPIEELSLPLGGASALQSAHDAGQTYLGPAPSAAHPVETQLWTALGAGEPSIVLVIPVLVKHRAVNLLYAHTLGGTPPRQLVSELEDLAKRASSSYMRLIRAARGS
jgi:hypothetical protein